MNFFNNIQYDFSTLYFNYNVLVSPKEVRDTGYLQYVLDGTNLEQESVDCLFERNFIFWSEQCLEKMIKQSIIIDNNEILKYFCLDKILNDFYPELEATVKFKSSLFKLNIYLDLFENGIVNRKIITDFIKLLRTKFLDFSKVDSKLMTKAFIIGNNLKISDYIYCLNLEDNYVDRVASCVKKIDSYNKYKDSIFHHDFNLLSSYSTRLFEYLSGKELLVRYLFDTYKRGRYSEDSRITNIPNSELYDFISNVFKVFKSTYLVEDYIEMLDYNTMKLLATVNKVLSKYPKYQDRDIAMANEEKDMLLLNGGDSMTTRDDTIIKLNNVIKELANLEEDVLDVGTVETLKEEEPKAMSKVSLDKLNLF